MEKIRSCPFCGAPPRVTTWDHGAYVSCWNPACPCVPSTLVCRTAEEAINFWNHGPEKVDVVKVIKCKNCKHRPMGENRDNLEFPDDKCPCKCEDYRYSWKPADDWFCGNGEQKNDE